MGDLSDGQKQVCMHHLHQPSRLCNRQCGRESCVEGDAYKMRMSYNRYNTSCQG
jgi:hypothetical protein